MQSMWHVLLHVTLSVWFSFQEEVPKGASQCCYNPKELPSVLLEAEPAAAEGVCSGPAEALAWPAGSQPLPAPAAAGTQAAAGSGGEKAARGGRTDQKRGRGKTMARRGGAQEEAGGGRGEGKVQDGLSHSLFPNAKAAEVQEQVCGLGRTVMWDNNCL